MFSVKRMLSYGLTAIVASASAYGGNVAVPENPRWKPIVDEVYLQEVGTKIETKAPVTAVAVFDSNAYVGDVSGVHRVDGDKLVGAGGPRGAISRLKVVDSALYAMGKNGLWRMVGGEWSQVASGAFVDVAAHLGGVIVASDVAVFNLTDSGLEELSNPDRPINGLLGVASYSESVYVRQAGRIGFLQGGRVNYNDVNDWGQFPHASTTRDIMTLGPAVLVSTDKGLAELRGMTWNTITGEDGLCYEDTTCVAEGFAGDYWVGSTRGAMRAVDGEFHYFAAGRWLPNDKVNAIAVSDDTAYIATDGGLGIITYEPYTMQKKSAWYKQWLIDYGQKRMGFVHTLNYDKETGKYTRFLSDNDGGWVCQYLDALCFEYAVTGDESVREEAVDVFKAIKWTEEVTPIDGFPARAIHAVGEQAGLAATGSAGRPSEWNLTADKQWQWKGDTSSDETAAQYFSVSIFYDLVARGEEKEKAKEHIQRMTDHIIESGWYLKDLDGKPTVWARWDPEFIFSPQHTDERGLNAVEAFAMVAVAQHMIGDEDYAGAKQQLIDFGYLRGMLRTKITFPGYTFFDDRLAFLAYYPLLRYETDPELRAVAMRSMQRGWEVKRLDNQPWFSFIYGALTGNECENELAIQHLREYPLDCIDYRYQNSHRADLHNLPDGMRSYLRDDWKPMSPRVHGTKRWDRNAIELDGGGSLGVRDPSGWLGAYWMGRYYGFIQAPTTSDPQMLTVPKRDVQLGAEPYDGPPRPHIF